MVTVHTNGFKKVRMLLCIRNGCLEGSFPLHGHVCLLLFCLCSTHPIPPAPPKASYSFWSITFTFKVGLGMQPEARVGGKGGRGLREGNRIWRNKEDTITAVQKRAGTNIFFKHTLVASSEVTGDTSKCMMKDIHDNKLCASVCTFDFLAN